MTLDPIVEEVRTIRDEIAKERDYDIDSIFEELRRLEAESSVRHVSLSGRRVPEADQADPVLVRGAA